MVVLAEFAIHRRAAVAAGSLEICFHLANRDIENRHVAAGLGRRSVGAATTQENRRVRDDGETMRMTPEFVQLHELAVLRIVLSRLLPLPQPAASPASELPPYTTIHRGRTSAARLARTAPKNNGNCHIPDNTCSHDT